MRASTVCYTASVLRQVAGTTLAVSTFALWGKNKHKMDEGEARVYNSCSHFHGGGEKVLVGHPSY